MGALHGVAAGHAHQFTGVRHEIDAVDVGKETLVFRGEADGPANVELLPADVVAKYLALTAVHTDQPEQGADHRRLARAVGPQQSNGADRCLYAQAVQSRDAAIGFRYIVELEQHREPGVKGSI